jgi:SAM-dependent methyltransferase
MSFTMDERGFYEDYFVNFKVKAPEVEKQRNRIERLRREVATLTAPRIGLFVGIGKGAEMGVGKGKMAGIDLPLTQLSLNKTKFPGNYYICGDARSLPFKRRTYDYVVCSEVIEHISERAQVLEELWRVLKPEGMLILSTPNWWSLYGLFRRIYQVISRQEFHAHGQPVDTWTTPASLKREMSLWFSVKRVRGSWYWPPTGKGEFQLFPGFFAKLFRLLNPADFLLGEILPFFGHIIWIAARPRAQGEVVSRNGGTSCFQSSRVRALVYLWLLAFTIYAFSKGGVLGIAWQYLRKLSF